MTPAEYKQLGEIIQFAKQAEIEFMNRCDQLAREIRERASRTGGVSQTLERLKAIDTLEAAAFAGFSESIGQLEEVAP